MSFNSSHSQVSFLEYSAKGNAASFVIMSTAEQEILNNLSDWKVNDVTSSISENNLQLQNKKDTSSNHRSNVENHSDTTSGKEENKNLSSSEEDLLAILSQETSRCLNKSRSLSDLNDVEENLSFSKNLSQKLIPKHALSSSKTENRPILFDRMSVFKKKLQLTKDKIIQDENTLKRTYYLNHTQLNKRLFTNHKNNSKSETTNQTRTENLSNKKIHIHDETNEVLVETNILKNLNTNDVTLQGSLGKHKKRTIISDVPTSKVFCSGNARIRQPGTNNSANVNAIHTDNFIKPFQETESFIYVVGDDTQKACQGFGNTEFPSNSWEDAANVNIQKSVTSHSKEQLPPNQVVSTDIQNNSSDDVETLPSSKELFDFETEQCRVKVPSPTVSARRKLQFSQKTPITKRSNVPRQRASPPLSGEINSALMPNNEIELNILQSKKAKSIINNPFKFTTEETKSMIKMIWDIYK